MNANVSGSGDISEIITKMLGDPENLSKVMSMVGALSASGMTVGLPPEKEKIHVEENLPPKKESEPRGGEKEKICSSRPKINQCDRIRLLEAMRPFLGDEKRAKLDTVIKLLGLAEAAGGLCSVKH